MAAQVKASILQPKGTTRSRSTPKDGTRFRLAQHAGGRVCATPGLSGTKGRNPGEIQERRAKEPLGDQKEAEKIGGLVPGLWALRYSRWPWVALAELDDDGSCEARVSPPDTVSAVVQERCCSEAHEDSLHCTTLTTAGAWVPREDLFHRAASSRCICDPAGVSSHRTGTCFSPL